MGSHRRYAVDYCITDGLSSIGNAWLFQVLHSLFIKQTEQNKRIPLLG